jgi:hypothetical protein
MLPLSKETDRGRLWIFQSLRRLLSLPSFALDEALLGWLLGISSFAYINIEKPDPKQPVSK